MRLDRLVQSGSNASQLTLVFEDGSTLKTSSFVAADFGLYPGLELSEEEMGQLKAAISRAKTRERAVRAVATSSLSERELQKRLVQRGADSRDAEEAVEWLKELHLMNDADTAAQLVRSAANKGYGRARIQNLLYEKGIPKELWADALSELPEMDSAIDKFLHQKLDGRQLDDKTVKKAVDALLRRGHNWQEIKAGLARYKEGCDFDAPDLEELE